MSPADLQGQVYVKMDEKYVYIKSLQGTHVEWVVVSFSTFFSLHTPDFYLIFVPTTTSLQMVN